MKFSRWLCSLLALCSLSFVSAQEVLPDMQVRVLDFSENPDFDRGDIRITLEFEELEAPARKAVIDELLALSGQPNLAYSVKYALKKKKKQLTPEGLYIYAIHCRYGLAVERDLESMRANLSLSAKQGYALAQYELGCCYLKGVGVAQDVAQGLEWLEKAAQQGNLKAQMLLARVYDNAEYKDVVDREKAFHYFEMAAQQGDAVAQFRLGEMLINARGCSKDVPRAMSLLEQAAKQELVFALNALAVIYEVGIECAPDAAKCEFWQQELAKVLDKRKDTMRGRPYANECIMVDACRIKKALVISRAEWFELLSDAYERGEDQYSRSLGQCYLYGFGVEQDMDATTKYFEAPARHGDAWAQSHFASACLRADDPAINKEGEIWWTRAAEAGHLAAMRDLAMYYVGFLMLPCRDIDYAKAAHWAKIAAEQQIAEGAYVYAYLLHRGWGVEENYNEASRYFLMAAKLGYASAWYTVAQRRMTYKDKTGMRVRADANTKEAAWEQHEMYLQGALLGDARCQFEVGQNLYSMAHFENKPEVGVYWLELALDQGEKDALDVLSRAYRTGIGVPKDKASYVAFIQKAARMGSVTAMADLLNNYIHGSNGFSQNLKESEKIALALTYRTGNTEGLSGQGVFQTNSWLVNIYACGKEVDLQDMSKAYQYASFFQANRNGSSYIKFCQMRQLVKMKDKAFPILNQEEFQALEKKALAGDAQAQHAVSVALLRGDVGGKTQAVEAERFLDMAVAQALPEAMIDKALYCQMGVTGKVDKKAALEHLQPLLEKDDAKAYYFAAYLCNVTNIGLPDDAGFRPPSKWYPYLWKAYELGSLDAAYEVANICLSMRSSAERVFARPIAEEKVWLALMEDIAKKGVLPAVSYLQFADSKDKAKALGWTVMLAEAGDSTAQDKLADYYERGTHVPKDLEKALYWAMKSGDAGDVKGMYRAGRLAMSVRKDYALALKYLKPAREIWPTMVQNLYDVALKNLQKQETKTDE